LAEVILKDVDKTNWDACCDLKLTTKQGGLVAPHMYTISESEVEPQFVPLAVYADDHVVGFAMYGLDPDDGKYWIYRLMIDVDHQGKGYGKAALQELVKVMSKLPDVDEIFAGYKPWNIVAAALFGELGFHKTGEMLSGEFITRLDLKEPKDTEG
jgi:diamine N-acetyltransferase